MKTPRRLWALGTLALLGLGISSYQTQHFYAVRSGDLGFKSFCNLSSAMNCDVVALSRYSELMFGLPLSSFAAGWFLALFSVAMMALVVEWRRDSLRVALGMTAFGTLFSVFYFYLMASVIKSLCLLCLGVDLVNILGLAIVVSMKSEWYDGTRLELARTRNLIITIGICVGVMVLTLKGFEPEQQTDQATINLLAQEVLNSPVVAVNAGDELPSVGPKGAPITIVEFADFQCPGCRTGAAMIRNVLDRYPGQVRLVFRNYPLDSECNKNIPQKMHPAACEAARLAYCANQQGKFYDAFETLFGNQAKLAPGHVADVLGDLGLDMGKLKTCAASPEADMSIARDTEEAARLGSNSTPTFFINGHKMQGALPMPAWQQILDTLLSKK